MVLTLLAVIGACGEEPRRPTSGDPQPQRPPAVDPGGSSTDYEASWRLLSGHGPEGSIELIEGAEISFIIVGERASGRAACNDYDVSLQISGSRFRALGGGMTEMGCAPDVTRAQDSYMSALMAADRIERTGNSLSLTAEDVELIFERVPPPPTSKLVGTAWKLESLIEGSGDQGLSISAASADLLLSSDGTFTGSTGCRDLSGKWREDGYEIHFFTMRADGNCAAELVAQDSHVVEVLGDGFTVEINGDRMIVTDERGAKGLDYRAASRPTEEGAAFTYKVRPRRIKSDETPVATFTNTGDLMLEYGNGYGVAVARDGWKSLEQPADSEIFCAFTDEAYILEPGASKSEGVSVCDRNGDPRNLKPGLYRVTKTVRVSGTGEALIAKAFFRVAP